MPGCPQIDRSEVRWQPMTAGLFASSAALERARPCPGGVVWTCLRHERGHHSPAGAEAPLLFDHNSIRSGSSQPLSVGRPFSTCACAHRQIGSHPDPTGLCVCPQTTSNVEFGHRSAAARGTSPTALHVNQVSQSPSLIVPWCQQASRNEKAEWPRALGARVVQLVSQPLRRLQTSRRHRLQEQPTIETRSSSMNMKSLSYRRVGVAELTIAQPSTPTNCQAPTVTGPSR